jgi:hypothetical protein
VFLKALYTHVCIFTLALQASKAVALVCGHRAVRSGVIGNFGVDDGDSLLCVKPDKPMMLTVHSCLMHGDPNGHVGAVVMQHQGQHVGSGGDGQGVEEQQQQQQAVPGGGTVDSWQFYSKEFLGVYETVPGVCVEPVVGELEDNGEGLGSEGGEEDISFLGVTLMDDFSLGCHEIADLLWECLDYGVDCTLDEGPHGGRQLLNDLLHGQGYQYHPLLMEILESGVIVTLLKERYGGNAEHFLKMFFPKENNQVFHLAYVLGAQWWLAAWLWNQVKTGKPRLWSCHWRGWLLKVSAAIMAQLEQPQELQEQQQPVEDEEGEWSSAGEAKNKCRKDSVAFSRESFCELQKMQIGQYVQNHRRGC